MEVGQLNKMLFLEDLPIKHKEDKLLLFVKATPNASKNKIGKVFNKSLKIYITAAAEAGQANKAIIELLSDKLNISKNNITLKQGITGSNKIIELSGNKDYIINSLKTITSLI